nr:transposase [Solitalea canadensis]
MGPFLSIDETSLSHGELYTVVTNKQAKGKAGTLVAIMEGTKSETIIPLLQKLSPKQRNKVQEITLDLAGNMSLIAKKCFPNATRVIDRFHVQQLATEALQEIRIKYRWQAIDAENQAIEDAKTAQVTYCPPVLSNGETLKQLLARSRYLLYKKEDNWTVEQAQRADLLFERYPDLRKAYELTQKLSWIFSTTTDKLYAFVRLAKWNELVEQSGFKSFNTLSRTIINHHQHILNYFGQQKYQCFGRIVQCQDQSVQSSIQRGGKCEFFPFQAG